MKHKNEFEKLLEYTRRLRSRYMFTLAAFTIYEKYQQLRAPNKVGVKQANKNAEIYNFHKYFFQITIESTRIYFFIELAKFFDIDKRNQALTVSYVLDYADQNIDKFSKEHFLKHHKKRDKLPEIFENYKEMTIADLDKLRQRIKYNETKIEKLKNYRDKYLAHDDIKKKRIPISARELKTLLNIVRDTIAMLCLKLDSSSNIYDNFSKEPACDVEKIINRLKEYEDGRMRKVREKYGI